LFFASDGSCAVEIALKMALQANQIKGMHHKNQFVSLKNSYHGETIATLSVSDVGLYKAPFEQYGLDCHFIEPVPYVKSQNDAEWHQCDKAWNQVLSQLEPIKDTICAVIIEPILQGAGGMLCYSADFLKKLSLYCEYNDIYLISDEIMTGFGRTGEWLALDHAGVKADMVCLSKGLTSGTLPLSVVCIDDGLYQLFYDDYETGKAFMHSHTYSGNATAISAAIATLKIMKRDSIHLSAKELGHTMLNEFTHIANETGKLSNIRQIGAMVAGDLEPIEGRRVGFELYQEALTQGAYLRPLGNTLYWMPPLNTSKIIIGNLAEITLNSIKGIYL
jgi:adenosylmethionine-8-amino-7-oxononanoate aminotransferase